MYKITITIILTKSNLRVIIDHYVQQSSKMSRCGEASFAKYLDINSRKLFENFFCLNGF